MGVVYEIIMFISENAVMQRLGCKDLVYQIRIQCMIRSFFKEIKHCNAHCYFVKTMQSSQAGDQAALSTMHCLSFSIGDPIIEKGGGWQTYAPIHGALSQIGLSMKMRKQLVRHI